MIKILRSAFAGVLGACLVSGTAASVLVSNLDEPTRGYNDISSTLWASQSFVTDSKTYALINIRAMVGDETGPTIPFAELRAADADGRMDTSPGGLIATITPPSMEGARSARAFIPNGRVLLAPNTKYYFLLGNQTQSPDTFQWSYAEGNNWFGPGAFDEYEYTFDGGGTWQLFGYENPFHMEVNVGPPQSLGTVVPIRIGG